MELINFRDKNVMIQAILSLTDSSGSKDISSDPWVKIICNYVTCIFFSKKTIKSNWKTDNQKKYIKNQTQKFEYRKTSRQNNKIDCTKKYFSKIYKDTI